MYIIIGCGSAGKQYVNALLELGTRRFDINIVDVNTEVLSEYKKQGFGTHEGLNNLQVIGGEDTAIVSNLGPDHVKTARELINLGVRKIIIEKPIGNKLEEIKKLLEEAENSSTEIYVHSRWMLLKAGEEIMSITKKHDLGSIISIDIKAGCICLSTGGTHWLDLANQLMDSEIEYVLGVSEHSYVNPRSKSIPMIGAYATVGYKNQKKLSVAFDNNHSHAPLFTVNYRNARIEVRLSGELMLYHRNKEDIKRFNDKITRYGELKLLDSKRLKAVNLFRKLIEQSNSKKEGDNHEKCKIALKSIKIIHGIEQSSIEKRTVKGYDIVDQDVSFT